MQEIVIPTSALNTIAIALSIIASAIILAGVLMRWAKQQAVRDVHIQQMLEEIKGLKETSLAHGVRISNLESESQRTRQDRQDAS